MKTSNKKPNGYWTLTKCHEEALKYNTKRDFRKESSSAYVTAKREKWLSIICSHMMELQKPSNYWNNINNCKQEALKYKSRIEFENKASGAYDASLRNDWMDEVCSHMIPAGNRYKRMVYVYDNSVYVGLTFNENSRNYQHFHDIVKREKSPVYKKFKETNVNPVYIKITDYIDVFEAQIIEKETVNKYRNDGWIILNKVRTGGLGGGIILWTKENSLAVAKICNSISEVCDKYPGAYNAIRNNNWIIEAYSHMKILITYWTKESCIEDAKRYNTRTKWQYGGGGAYRYARIHGFLNECTTHMKTFSKPMGYWTKERCAEVAKLCLTKGEFKDRFISAYRKCLKNNWAIEICNHLIDRPSRRIY